MPPPPPPSPYYCYSCSRYVNITPSNPNLIVCPHCSGGFLEQATAASPPRLPTPSPPARRLNRHLLTPDTPRRRGRRAVTADDRAPFNPVIVLRSPEPVNESSTVTGFELYYDDGAGTGLRPLPATMSEFLMGSGFDRLLDQLSQIEVHGVRPVQPPSASKSAIESMPTVEISGKHMLSDCHCAVCTDAFSVGDEAREMPCKHIYHGECILPWLAIRNSCPVCRHEMPAEAAAGGEESAGLTIWRLPGGGFAVGRFAGGRRVGEREIPMVYTEMDGGANGVGERRRRVSWAERGEQATERRGIAGAVRSLFSIFSRRRRSSALSRSQSTADRRTTDMFVRSEWEA